MNVLAIDFSSDPKNRGFSHYIDGVCVYAGTVYPGPSLYDLAIVEQPWTGGKQGKAGRQSLITMGLYAGFLLGRAGARRFCAVPVLTWKNRVIPGFGGAAKAMYTDNLRQKWPELAGETDDVVDAVGLGASCWSRALGWGPRDPRMVFAYTEKELKEWEIK